MKSGLKLENGSLLWLKDPTPGSFNLLSCCPTSAWVTPSLIRRCLNFSANDSSSRGSTSSVCPIAAALAAAAAMAAAE